MSHSQLNYLFIFSFKGVDKHDWTFNMNNMNTSLSYEPHNRVSQKQYSPQGQIEQPVFGSK